MRWFKHHVFTNLLTVMMHPIPRALSVAAQYSPYCGQTHRFEAEGVVGEKTGGSGGSGFKLQELDPSNAKYESVKTQFTTKWHKTSTAPTVANIFSIKVGRYVCRHSLVGEVSCVLHMVAPSTSNCLDRFRDMDVCQER